MFIFQFQLARSFETNCVDVTKGS